ncbi:hypothetical protein BE25_0214 [Staphylococcus phage vB_SepM_BE25]|jgi:hypothetical protein|uniref:Phage PVL protein n=2 Tax=unclassified Sepunavirus TaxID=2315193 RepID=A0AAX3Y2I1_9CAUD|nr:hypothetical protein Twillingate_198 [Staphylococcus phage Twillingate]AXY84076.1 hypothetical protein Terranova_196 [Staphylococcus phage Terranova]MDU1018342.1 hypothetical protein [Clostridium perfringens]QLF86931.1 hypothetical protein BESEP4_00197 [Staphylococcus phage vB_SepM_BE04]QLF87112.1 hypothetical protein BESEP5_00170 [Staphylococcus phage vB_SepM_BE05]QLF87320.1 hypothetical protein BESEP6_00166 [Staphylococcus phage vB_SepM_BE06]QLF87383.1 hypothetical protein BESEP7_00035 [
MVKIKRKIEMALPELIEYVWKNNIKEKTFYSNLDNSCVRFNRFQTVFIDDPINKDETFTVEVEEEITEKTKLDSVLEIYTNLDYTKSKFPDIHKSVSINDILGYTSNRIVTKCIYLVNEDDTMTLIWKDGELVK